MLIAIAPTLGWAWGGDCVLYDVYKSWVCMNN